MNFNLALKIFNLSGLLILLLTMVMTGPTERSYPPSLIYPAIEPPSPDPKADSRWAKIFEGEEFTNAKPNCDK